MKAATFASRLALLAAAFGLLAAWQVGSATADDDRGRLQAVYTLTNQAAGNAVAVFDRSDDGSLTAAGEVPTGASAPAAASATRVRSRWTSTGGSYSP